MYRSATKRSLNNGVFERATLEKATSKSLSSENWKLIMEICDMVNSREDGSKTALKAIKKRLQQNAGRNNSVIMYTLKVLEACVKNCGKKFHSLAMQKDFIQDLVKLISAKNNPSPEIQRKVLNLIQIWADTFQDNIDLQGVVSVYNELKTKNIEFPIYDDFEMEKNIIFTESSERLNSPLSEKQKKIVLSDEEMLKLKRELELMKGTIEVFGEMLKILIPGKTDSNDLKSLHVCFTGLIQLL
ncbi:TOM1-like protein 2 isoform X2 [Centruroides sculpturatus]|uniref:TOM1-like protein 2 isoform X2 n=1 Tax=Centruroides sculpturatus TaxID=218467 RepID=UPI000C6DBCE9|nr:TOM1-like protein 2 isoform X2 [Centruroides sculpturatus]